MHANVLCIRLRCNHKCVCVELDFPVSSGVSYDRSFFHSLINGFIKPDQHRPSRVDRFSRISIYVEVTWFDVIFSVLFDKMCPKSIV